MLTNFISTTTINIPIQFNCKFPSNSAKLTIRPGIGRYESLLSIYTKIIKFKQFVAMLQSILVTMIFELIVI